MPASVTRQRVLGASGRGGELLARVLRPLLASGRPSKRGWRRVEERTALLGRGLELGLGGESDGGGCGESGCWLCKGSRHIYCVLAHTCGVSE